MSSHCEFCLEGTFCMNNPSFFKFSKSIGATSEDELIPAGVIYVKTEFGDTKIAHSDEALAISEFKKQQDRQGMVLADNESIFAMNTEYLPLTLKKGTSPADDIYQAVHKGHEKYLYTLEEFDGHIETVRKTVNKSVASMKKGDISALPMKSKNKSPCEYCKFKPICRNVK